MCRILISVAVIAGSGYLYGCSGTGSSPGDGVADGALGSACDLDARACADALVCEALLDGEPLCASPVVIRGIVLDLADDTSIEGALVQAVDANGAAAGTTGVTDADGTYSLTVPAMRNADGGPIEGIYTLRVQAAAYQEFPTAIRPALPLDAASAQSAEEGWLIESALTTVGLLRIPGDSGELGSISGAIQADANAGVLVIAVDGETSLTGFSDSDGHYVIFNVPSGSYSVQGYSGGLQLDPTSATVVDGEAVLGVDLLLSDRPLSTVSGSVQIVNAPGGSVTSVVLSVESTFDEAVGLGKVPPGLRIGDVTGAFSINDVPDGRYVVLAAFENDDLVRDPDQTIGGTAIVSIEVPDPTTGTTIDLSEGFKVTGALEVVQPGADGPEQVFTATPIFEWEDDSSEDGYELRILDAFGNEVWQDEIGSVSGSATVTHEYGGPPLQSGMFYQFRVISFREQSGERTAISATEDLRGVFFYLSGDTSSDGVQEPNG